MDGFICIYKPTDYTSFDVIAILRRLFGTKRIGHSGTLDPMAEGVLPVFMGAATKAIDYCQDSDKQYRAAFKIGLTTDTQDITGKVLTSVPPDVPCYVSKLRLEEAVTSFIGEIEQLPPMYSAVKVDGKRLYDSARKGIEVERQTRAITVHNIEIEQYNNNEGILKIDCSKGTYVRTLIHDIGQVLGFGAVMTALQRTRSNGFSLEECHSLQTLRDAYEKFSENPSKMKEFLSPLENLFDFPKAFLDEKQTSLFKNGAILNADLVLFEKVYDGTYSILDNNKRIIALGKIERDHSLSVSRRFNYTV